MINKMTTCFFCFYISDDGKEYGKSIFWKHVAVFFGGEFVQGISAEINYDAVEGFISM